MMFSYSYRLDKKENEQLIRMVAKEKFFQFFLFQKTIQGYYLSLKEKEDINQTTLKYENEKIVFNNRIADNDSFDSVYEQENGRSTDQSKGNE